MKLDISFERLIEIMSRSRLSVSSFCCCISSYMPAASASAAIDPINALVLAVPSKLRGISRVLQALSVSMRDKHLGIADL